ncbi:MAG TPA: hypothetical protein VHL11_23545 [Phototrophicaceae bacterium]|jgi:hypothetical protein|nr:hypothetical protein [Phototrophicaceae bacterium]
MRKNQDFVDGWLYAANQQFAAGDLDAPVNRDEIIKTLKRNYGVIDLKLWVRIPMGIITLFLTAILSLFILQTISRLFLSMPGLIGLLDKLLVFLVLLFLIFMGYVLLVLAFHLFFPRKNRVQIARELLNKGQIISGRVIDINAESIRDAVMTYEFQNAAHKRIRGKYYYRDLPLIINLARREFRPDPTITYRPHPKPEDIKIRYANDKVHAPL